MGFTSFFIDLNLQWITVLIISIIIIKKTSNIFEMTKENQDFHHPFSLKYKRVKILYHCLLNYGYTCCQAFHGSGKLLTIINPHLKLSEVSKKHLK